MACIETRNITITAAPDPSKDCGYRFAMVEKGSNVTNDEIKSAKSNGVKQSDYHTFHFTLQNLEGSDLQFLNDPFDVMWVKPGNSSNPGSCPDKRMTDGDFCVGQITPSTLTVHNANSRNCKHKFVLNFYGTRADGSKGVVPYDPVWTNGNGGSP